MLNAADRQLLAMVQKEISGGPRRIYLPNSLVSLASQEGLDEVRRLCKLNGVSIEILKD